jgi:hypothetical protein
VWYRGSLRSQGELLGHTYDQYPYVRINQVPYRLNSFDSIRLVDPESPEPPNWHRLPPGGTLTRPRPHEVQDLEACLGQIIPPGISHKVLAEEIWGRGFEVFLTGSTVREILLRGSPTDPEFVTTMPLGRLCAVVRDMYGPERVSFGDHDAISGRLRVGGPQGQPDGFATVRVFALESPGSQDAKFGSSFADDVRYRDLTCDAIYYDPVNKVFVDPTGLGLADAASCRLRPVCDGSIRPPGELAVVGLRMVALVMDSHSVEGGASVLEDLLRLLPALPAELRVSALRVHVLDPAGRRGEGDPWEAARDVFGEYGLQALWNTHLQPLRELQ